MLVSYSLFLHRAGLGEVTAMSQSKIMSLSWLGLSIGRTEMGIVVRSFLPEPPAPSLYAGIQIEQSDGG